jgi:hypothetical protein
LRLAGPDVVGSRSISRGQHGPAKVYWEECKKFEFEANPHQWFLTASLLHDQAVALHASRTQGRFIRDDFRDTPTRTAWAATNKATFLLCAFALENAIKAFLVYQHPAWISDGYLHDEVCSHKLVSLSGKTSLIPYARRSRRRRLLWWVDGPVGPTQAAH